MKEIINLISKELNLQNRSVNETIKLLNEGSTIPFISRYRKELTGSLDEVQIENISNSLKKLTEIIKRKKTIISTIEDLGKLTKELEQKITETWDINILEDLYLPYKQKRKTKAEKARQKGLEPLAEKIFNQQEKITSLIISKYISQDVVNETEAINGAKDIIAEWINEDSNSRKLLRNNFQKFAIIKSKLVKGKEIEGEKFSDYFEYSESIIKCQSHRLLAIRRGENQGFLKITIEPDKEIILEKLNKLFIKSNINNNIIEEAISDSYKRLLQPSIETEFKKLLKEKADAESIKVFSSNLRQLLTSPPLGEKNILAIDPGYKSGCKIVCLSKNGDLLHNETIFPHAPQNQSGKSKSKLNGLVESYDIQAIAIGNGTASRETEQLVKSTNFNKDIEVYTVSESGASIYSASKIAREEFPNYDVTVRGSVSIGRRLQDPLAELVKLDPKSIGVGQYQHDVDQKELKESLNQVVESCVNSIGINLNTASSHLLMHVSGLGPQVAKNIVDYRKEIKEFTNRNQLKKVSKLGPKAYEQCAGFLRIKNGKNILDNTAVHPESYAIVTKMAESINCKIDELVKNNELIDKIKLEDFVTSKIGLPTLRDIKKELKKPGIDPRSKIETFNFNKNIFKISDLEIGQILPGIITNITNFGAFVDIGIKENGLVHISQICDEFIKDPQEKLKINEKVIAKVISVDYDRKRIQLSLKNINL